MAEDVDGEGVVLGGQELRDPVDLREPAGTDDAVDEDDGGRPATVAKGADDVGSARGPDHERVDDPQDRLPLRAVRAHPRAPPREAG